MVKEEEMSIALSSSHPSLHQAGLLSRSQTQVCFCPRAFAHADPSAGKWLSMTLPYPVISAALIGYFIDSFVYVSIICFPPLEHKLLEVRSVHLFSLNPQSAEHTWHVVGLQTNLCPD